MLDFTDAYKDDRPRDKIQGRSHRMYRDIQEYPIPVSLKAGAHLQKLTPQMDI